MCVHVGSVRGRPGSGAGRMGRSGRHHSMDDPLSFSAGMPLE